MSLARKKKEEGKRKDRLFLIRLFIIFSTLKTIVYEVKQNVFHKQSGSLMIRQHPHPRATIKPTPHPPSRPRPLLNPGTWLVLMRIGRPTGSPNTHCKQTISLTSPRCLQGIPATCARVHHRRQG